MMPAQQTTSATRRTQPSPRVSEKQMKLPMTDLETDRDSRTQSIVREYALFIGTGLFAAVLTVLTVLSAHLHR